MCILFFNFHHSLTGGCGDPPYLPATAQHWHGTLPSRLGLLLHIPLVFPSGLSYFVFRPLNGIQNSNFLCVLCVSSEAS
jgi:hypothetical protein